jgi:exosortase H (IPTLxxWG-CTERM-specific)
MPPSFLIRFGLICASLYALLHWLPPDFLMPVNAHTASVLATALHAVGISAAARMDIVFGGGFSVRIIPECTVMLMAGLYLAFLLAFPAPAGGKAVGLLVGLPALYGLNLLRLVAVYLAGLSDERLFKILHVYLGEVAMVLGVCVACLTWLLFVAADGHRRLLPCPGFLLRLAAISAPLCLVWVYVNRGYVEMLDRFVAAAFLLFDYRLIMPRTHDIYFQTFNIVALIALIGASCNLPLLHRLQALALGLSIAVMLHAGFRTLNVLLTGFGFLGVLPFSALVATAGQYLLPVMIWLRLGALTWKDPKRARREKQNPFGCARWPAARSGEGARYCGSRGLPDA